MATGVSSQDVRVYATSYPSVSLTDEATTSTDLTTFTITNQVKRLLDPAVAVVVQAAHDALQNVTVTGGPTNGTFTLTFSADTTAGIAFNAPASAVQSALQALASIGAGNVLVTGSAGGPYTVEFTAALGQAAQALLTADGTLLTGGTSPGVTVATTQAGSGFTTISAGFTLRLVGAMVIFPIAQPAGTAVRLHSGNYLPYLAIVGANTAEFAGALATQDTTDFTDNGWKASTPTVLSGTLKCHAFWRNSAIIKNLTNRDLLAVSFFDGDEYLEGYCWVANSDLKSATTGVVETDYTFQLTDQFFVNS